MLLTGLLGCGGGDPTAASPCDPAAEPVCGCETTSVSIGDGQPVFTALVAGQDVTMVHGPQGGWHVLASIRVANSNEFVSIGYTIDLLPEMTRISDNLYNVRLPVWGECAGELADIYGYLDVTMLAEGEANTPPELLVGRELRLTMTVTDIDGRSASETVDVVGTPDPMDADTGG